MLTVGLMTLGLQAPPARASGAYPEEAVKAAFLYRFAGYVDWPAQVADVPQFTIAVLGGDEVAEQLKQLLVDRRIQNKPARTEPIKTLRELGEAQMLYIGSGFKGNLRALLVALKERPVLVVTDQPDGLESGGTVNFLVEDQHVRFEVSTAAAKRSGLKVSSDLLAVAEHVKTGDLRQNSLCRPESAFTLHCFLWVARR